MKTRKKKLTWSSKSVRRVTLLFFRSILCSCSDVCGMPSKSPASTTFQEPSMLESALEEEKEKGEGKGGREGNEEEEDEEVAAADPPPAAASVSLSSSPGVHPLDHTTISPVRESSKHAAWWIKKPPSSASIVTGLECCGCDWPRGATWTTMLPVPILTHCAGPLSPTM